MNKSLITNLLSILIIIVGYFYRDNYSFIIITGVFALSGGITNWIAIHMLFEKVPFLYGSGVILDKFEDIKLGIKNLILQELFTETQINNFLLDGKASTSETIINKIDFDKVFIGLVEAIEGSQLGGMLAMVGGRKALDPLKEPFTKKLKIIIEDFVSENTSSDNSSDAKLERHNVKLKKNHYSKNDKGASRLARGLGRVFWWFFGLNTKSCWI